MHCRFPLAMIRHVVLSAVRALRRRAGHTLLTVLGLALAVACALLLGLHVQNELSYDAYHEAADRIVRVVSEDSTGRRRAKVSALVGPRLAAERTEAEAVVRLDRKRRATVRRGGRTMLEDRFFYADSTFFEVFSFDLLRGDASEALDGPRSAVLTKSAAERYFPGRNPVGQPLPVAGVDTFTVTGVMEDVPANSHFRPAVVASFQAKGPVDRWFAASAWTYVRLRPGTTMEEAGAALGAFNADKGWSQPRLAGYHAQRLTDIHLHSHLVEEIGPNGSAQRVGLLATAALLILGVACLNVVILALARAADRAPSIGVRRALGGGRTQVALQFFVEGGLLVGAAVGAGAAAAVALLPAFNRLIGASLEASMWLRPSFLGGAGLLAVGTAAVAAAYPALVSASRRPVDVLRSRGASSSGAPALQRGLVVVQFAASVLLLIGTVAAHRQVDHLLGADMGFDAERVVSMPALGPLAERQGAVVEALRSRPGVARVSRASGSPLDPRVNDYRVEGRPVELHNLLVDASYVETLGLEVAAGRDFDAARPGDAFQRVLVNRRAADVLGWEDPVGKTFRRQGRGFGRNRELQVIGVVDGLHTESLRRPVRPTVLQVVPPFFNTFLVRVEPGRLPAALASMREVWQAFAPGRAFEYADLGARVERLYSQEKRLRNLTTAFGAVALAVACLGLIGLAAREARRRRREVGIRKALGATVEGLAARLTGDLLRLVALGLAVALPLGIVGVDRWLEQFAYAAPLPLAGAAAVAAATLVVAALATGVHALRSARTSPALVLRDE